MININRKLLSSGIKSDEYWVLSHIAKYMNNRNWCFPSRETLQKQTGFGRDKLDKSLKGLVSKNMLKKGQRRALKTGGFTSNRYTITTSFIGVYVNLLGAGDDLPVTENQDTVPVTENPYTEKPVTVKAYTKYCEILFKYCKEDFKYCEEDSPQLQFEKVMDSIIGKQENDKPPKDSSEKRKKVAAKKEKVSIKIEAGYNGAWCDYENDIRTNPEKDFTDQFKVKALENYLNESTSLRVSDAKGVCRCKGLNYATQVHDWAMMTYDSFKYPLNIRTKAEIGKRFLTTLKKYDWKPTTTEPKNGQYLKLKDRSKQT